LLGHCNEFFAVDLSESCVAYCRQRFTSASRTHFFANDGRSLAMVPEGVDFVFSFDSLVHVEIDVLREYIWQIAQKLSSTGVAFLHHSNALGEQVDRALARKNARAESVSATIVKELFEDSGCRVLVQEEINWDGPSRIDCFTTSCRAGAYVDHEFVRIVNDGFMDEAVAIRNNHAPYHGV
jgi:cyclopropane fatty-acyl-phospholipid synthase-like methyltransferase